MMLRVAVLRSLVLVALAVPAAAQAPAIPLEQGGRIRIDSPLDPGRVVDARLVRVEPEWIGFSLAGDSLVWTRRLEFVDRISLRQARPTSSRLLRGAAWGAFLGTSVGAMSAPFVAFGTDSDISDWSAVGLGAGAGALVGTALGSLWGVLRPGYQWREFYTVPAR